MRETWWLSPEARAWTAPVRARSVAGWMAAAAAGRVLSTDRDAAAVRLDLDGRPVLLKWRAVRPERRTRTWLRASRERREALGLLAARALGIDVPAPLAVGERRDRAGRLLGAVLLRPWIEGLQPADEALAGAAGERLLPALAEALARWHASGYRHGDCWPKNLLVSPDGTRVLPIGAPRARRTAPDAPHRIRRDRARWMDLARLAAGLPRPGDPLRVLAPYRRALSAPGSDPFLAPPEPLAAAVAPLLAHVLAKRAADERTRPQREPHGPPPPVPLPPDPRPPRRRERLLPSLSQEPV